MWALLHQMATLSTTKMSSFSCCLHHRTIKIRCNNILANYHYTLRYEIVLRFQRNYEQIHCLWINFFLSIFPQYFIYENVVVIVLLFLYFCFILFFFLSLKLALPVVNFFFFFNFYLQYFIYAILSP